MWTATIQALLTIAGGGSAIALYTTAYGVGAHALCVILANHGLFGVSPADCGPAAELVSAAVVIIMTIQKGSTQANAAVAAPPGPVNRRSIMHSDAVAGAYDTLGYTYDSIAPWPLAQGDGSSPAMVNHAKVSGLR